MAVTYTNRICQADDGTGYSFFYNSNPRGEATTWKTQLPEIILSSADITFGSNKSNAAARNSATLYQIGQQCPEKGMRVRIPNSFTMLDFTGPSRYIGGKLQPINFILEGIQPGVEVTSIEPTKNSFYFGDGVVACSQSPSYRVFQGFEDLILITRTKIMVEGFGKIFRARGLTIISEDTNCALHLKHMYGAYIEDVYITQSFGDGVFEEECIAVNHANIAVRSCLGRGLKIWGVDSQFSSGNFVHLDSEQNSNYQVDLQYCKNSHFWGYLEGNNRIRMYRCKDLAFYGEGMDFKNTATYTIDAYSYLQNPLIWPHASTAYSPPRSTNPYGNGGTGIVVTVTNQYNLSVVWNNASSIYWVDLCPGWDFLQDHRYEISVTISALSGGQGGIAGWMYFSSNGTLADAAYFTENNTYVIKPFCENGGTAQNRLFLAGYNTGAFTVVLNYVKEITKA